MVNYEQVRREHSADNWNGDRELTSAASSADLFPKVVELQRRLGAQGFVIASTTSAMNAVMPLKIIIGNSSYTRDKVQQGLIKSVGPILASHVRKSPCPVYWHEDSSEAHQLDVPRPAQLISMPNASMHGVAFPVHLGGRKTGIAVFFAPSITISREMLMDIHKKTFILLKTLLKIELSSKVDVISINNRETECLQFAGNGMTSDDIAEQLGLSVHTVNAHLSSATSKLDSVNRIQAIAKAIRLGLIS
ncbi:helix-turn-helix transcriptional regulator [Lentilitoribacter sp. Alg239-R112]|jgi:DNA-binding CsgD family transcriptional regulator|uniref:response regulator transcription factor n=1 Tax=Lentilitoribacter sp. Alg239-R112 TaxID=2305987 RepID=UPI0013A6CA38|nr:helix-turn-helix transcriptional regulator [Lentilitoribacter sp. Alg239-R112]